MIAVLDAVSKDALADLVIDMLRLDAGDETLDGPDLCRAFCTAFEPIARIRGDRVPNPERVNEKINRVRMLRAGGKHG